MIVLAIAGCTDSDGRESTYPCNLLHTDEIAAVMRATVTSFSISSGILPRPGLALCTYSTSASFGAVTLAVQRPGQLAFEQTRDQARTNQSFGRFVPLDELGDGAFSQGGVVHMLQRDAYVQVSAQYSDNTFAPIAQRLAQHVLPRLP
jgi:hypothetical protein